jgi:glycosyltransferase involved in cell wall biosynthesis
VTRKHIAIVISGLGAGGAEIVVSQVARHWIAQGHRVSILAFDTPEDPIFHPMPEGAEIHRLGLIPAQRRFGAYVSISRKLIRLRRVIALDRPDVVVSFLTKNNLLAMVATSGKSIPVICSERNNPERQHAHPFWNAALRLGYRKAALIVCQTKAVRRCFHPAVRPKIRVIPNPIRSSDSPRKTSDPPRIVAVGRLTHQKGFDILLAAFALLHQKFPQWQLDIWGEGADRPALEELIRTHGLERRAALRGMSPRPGSWVEAADIFVLSSRYEGFGNVLGEAMAAGLPVVSTFCDFGPDEIVTHGYDGLLVATENPPALAQGMARLMDDVQLRERLGRAAAIAARRFAPENILPLWDDALAHVTRSPPANPAPFLIAQGGVPEAAK